LATLNATAFASATQVFVMCKKFCIRIKTICGNLTAGEKWSVAMEMAAETVGLEQYGIGPKIRRLRKKKDLSLVRLGDHTGMSAGLLSKIETEQLIPTLPTLMQIATVFGVGLEHFFAVGAESPKAAIVRRSDRLRLPNRTDGAAPTFWFESLDFPATDRRMDAYLATFEPGATPTEPHRHQGDELIYVIRGTMVLSFDNEAVELHEGDSAYFDPSYPHSYSQKGKQPCRAVVAVASAR
jgi:quercetin dioxygenase-like cupin family protein/DNA-binding XRE family transcriptional regulator